MATAPLPSFIVGAVYVDMALHAFVLAAIFRTKFQLWWRGEVSLAVGQSNVHSAELEHQAPWPKSAAPPAGCQLAEIMKMLDRIEAKLERFADRVE